MAQLGELDAEGRARATLLAREMSGRSGEGCQGSLFDAPWPEKTVKVRLNAVPLERTRAFGVVWLGWLLWRALKLDELLDRVIPAGHQLVAWANVIAILAIGRLCEPSSELHVAVSAGTGALRWRICSGRPAMRSTTWQGSVSFGLQPCSGRCRKFRTPRGVRVDPINQITHLLEAGYRDKPALSTLDDAEHPSNHRPRSTTPKLPTSTCPR